MPYTRWFVDQLPQIRSPLRQRNSSGGGAEPAALDAPAARGGLIPFDQQLIAP